MSNPTQNDCPCGSQRPYSHCCEPYHQFQAQPETAEQLMRSRYSGYTLNLVKYIHRSWHPSTRLSKAELHNSTPVQWLGLQIISAQGGADDKQGSVEFIATYVDLNAAKTGQTPVQLHERSRFTKTSKGWVYLDGEHLS